VKQIATRVLPLIPQWCALNRTYYRTLGKSGSAHPFEEATRPARGGGAPSRQVRGTRLPRPWRDGVVIFIY